MKRDISAARARGLRRRLLAWYRAARRDLPWRFPPGGGDPYRIWISEVMLQQTQVATVVPYYERFLARFPTLRALARAREEDVLAAWSGLGYYARARALRRAAREAIARHGGLPGTVEELRELPGFGPYTAGAVASIAFGAPTPAVDGNAGRVLARLFLVRAASGTRAFQRSVWALAEALVRGGAGSAGDLNQALIELGALVCRPKAPACRRCPLARSCDARMAGEEDAVPTARRRGKPRRVRLAVAALTAARRVLLVRRPAAGLFAAMWAPPAVELRGREDPALAISAEIGREPSVVTGEFEYRGRVERVLSHRRLELLVFGARIRSSPRKGEGWRLASHPELEDLPIPAAFRVALDLALDEQGGGGVGSRRERV